MYIRHDDEYTVRTYLVTNVYVSIYGYISTKRERVRERVSEMISSILADTTSARCPEVK